MPERKYTYKVEIDAAQAKAQATALRQQMTADLDAIEQRKATTAQAAEVRKRAAADEKAMLDSIRRAKQQVERQEAEQKRLTATTEREARKRAAAEERAARQAEQEAKRVARAQEAEQKRLTTATEREARRRAQAETRARIGTRFSIGGAWNQLDMMASMAAGGLAAFGVAQVGQQIYGAGASGAQSIRQQATFKEFAARMGQDANAIIAAVKRASRETITEFDAMGLASQVLAAKFSQGSTNIAGDLETVTAASRRFSQIFTDENGAAMSTQEIFARMVKFAREGNKELVDAFGIDNNTIAAAMNTTVEGMASAGGATLRWQGLVKVLNAELERLGPAAITVADRYEQSQSRILDARQRIQQALAEPMAAVGEGVANVAEAGVMLTGNAPIEKLRSMVNTNKATGGMGTLNARAYKEATAALDAYDAAMAKNASTATMYAGSLRTLVNTLVNQGTLTDEGVSQLEQMATALQLVADGNDAYTTTMRIANMEQIKASSQLLDFAVKMAELEQLYLSGTISQQAYTSQLYQMAIGMGAVKTEIENTLPALREFTTLAGGGAGGGTAERRGYDWMTPEALGLDAEDVAWLDRLSAGYTARAEGIASRKAAAEANEPYTAAGQDKLRLKFVMDLQKQAAEDERQAAKEAQREWESAAKKTAAEFEKAAEDAAAAFEDALRKVPGLLGTSEVTDEQMAAAKAGVPQNFADNYLRRLADEVAGNKDWEGIDIQDAARRAGIDGSLPKDIILQQVRSAWEDSSLFADGRNMDLITDFGGLDAIKANLARQDASASGQKALIDYMTSIGLGPAAPGETGAAGVTSPEQAPQAAADTLAAIQAAFAAEDVAKSLSAVGENTLALIHAGYRTGAMKADWTGPIVDAVVSQLAGQLAGMLEGEGEAPPP